MTPDRREIFLHIQAAGPRFTSSPPRDNWGRSTPHDPKACPTCQAWLDLDVVEKSEAS